MPKTINYPLAKKLYDAGVVIESEYYYSSYKWENDFIICPKEDTCTAEYDYFPATNCEEVIEFLKRDISIQYSDIFNQYVISNKTKDTVIFRDTLLEALEATLEYLLTNGYIWQNTKN